MTTNFLDFVKPELLILIPVLYLIGIAIKKSKIRDTLIPIMLGACGVVLSAIYVYATTPIDSSTSFFSALFLAITQGILCAGASVYINQIIKQAEKGKEE